MYFCGLKGMMPGITEMLEEVSKEKGLIWEDKLKEWKKAGQWHVEVCPLCPSLAESRRGGRGRALARMPVRSRFGVHFWPTRPIRVLVHRHPLVTPVCAGVLSPRCGTSSASHACGVD